MTPPEKTPGYIYFSPAMFPVAGSEIDVARIVFTAQVADTYLSQQPADALRPFLLGPAPLAPSGRAWPPDFSASYEPMLNNTQYGFMSNKPGVAVRGELFNTSTLELTVVLV
jgi:hypothetical protein